MISDSDSDGAPNLHHPATASSYYAHSRHLDMKLPYSTRQNVHLPRHTHDMIISNSTRPNYLISQSTNMPLTSTMYSRRHVMHLPPPSGSSIRGYNIPSMMHQIQQSRKLIRASSANPHVRRSQLPSHEFYVPNSQPHSPDLTHTTLYYKTHSSQRNLPNLSNTSTSSQVGKDRSHGSRSPISPTRNHSNNSTLLAGNPSLFIRTNQVTQESEEASLEQILQDVANVSSLISFQFCNHKATNLKGIKSFKNLTELDVSGNLLQKPEHQILQLRYIKKLNLSNNHIHQFWRLPKSLELLSISHNGLTSLANIAGCLPNLVVLDISHNKLDSLENISLMTKLRILQASHNRIEDLSHFRKLKDQGNLKELDLSSNNLEVVSSLNDLRGLVKLELLNMRHNHLENEKNFQRKAEECLKGTGLRFFKEERIFASSKRNLKSSVLLTSAREGKDGSGLWHSCVEFQEVHSDTTRSLESTLNSKLGQVLESLKSSQTVTPKVEDQKRQEGSHPSGKLVDNSNYNNNNPSQFQPTINNNPKRPKLPSLQLGGIKEAKLSGLMDSLVNRPLMFNAAPPPAAPNKTPQILTIDEVVAQEESKRSTLRNEQNKMDFNKVQRIGHLDDIEEKKDSINCFEYEESDSDSDSDIMPPPVSKGPPSFLKDKLKLNIPGQKVIKLNKTVDDQMHHESPPKSAEAQSKSFSKKISIVKTTDFEVDPLESQKSNPPKSSKRIVRPEQIRFKHNGGFATFNKPEGYSHDQINLEEVVLPSRFVYSSTPTLHSQEDSPAMATMSMTQILFDLEKRNSYLHSQLQTRRQNIKEEGRSFTFTDQQKNFEMHAPQFEELSFDGVGINPEASFSHLQQAAILQERDSLIQFNEMLQESLEKLRRKWESKKELLKYYERTSAQKALKIEKLEGSLSNFMLEFRDFAKSILKDKYSKRFGNIASQIYKLKESGFSQIPNQFKELFCELVRTFELNLNQREKLEVVNDELAWRNKENEQKLESFNKAEARLEMIIQDLSSQLSINARGGSAQQSPGEKAKIADLEKNLEKQTKLKETYLKDMQDIRLKNRKEKKALEEKVKELDVENRRLKSVQMAQQQSEDNKSICSVKQDRNQTIVSSRMTPSELRRGSYLANDKQVQIERLTELLKEKETTLAEVQLQYKTSQEEMKHKINILEEKLAKKSNILRLQPSHFRRKSDCLTHGVGLVESHNSFIGHTRSSFDQKYSRITEMPQNSFHFYPQLEEKNEKESEKENKVRSEQNSGRISKEQMHSGRYFESKRHPNLMMSITPRNWFGNDDSRVASAQVNQTTPDDHLGNTSLMNMKRDHFNQSFNIDSTDQTMQLATPCRTHADYKSYLKNGPGLLANNSMYYPSPLSIQHSTPGVNGVFSRGGYFTTDSEKQFFRDDGSRGRKGAGKFMSKKISSYIDALKHKNDHLREKLSTSIEQRKKLKEQLTSCNIVIKNLATTVRPKSSGLKRTCDGNTSFRRMTLPRESTKTLPH